MSSLAEFFGNKWVDFIGEYELGDELMKVSKALVEERKTNTVIPAPGEPRLFNHFKLTHPEEVKVVIPGLEPYHSINDYVGLSFGTNTDEAPPSLKTLLEELERTHGGCTDISLETWGPKGVFMPLLANSTLLDAAYSHITLWSNFSKLVIESLNKRDNIIWVLFGNYVKDIKGWITNPSHTILEYGHPSPLNIDNPVVGSDCFKHIDYELEQLGKRVVWTN